ncbi:MAG: hypothetical protein KDB08_07945 [Microthrixaceae bacterium]|nr:hypothetical protein [Microthrixaceae bacterium]
MFSGSLMIYISFAIWALTIIVCALVLYLVVRLAVTAALKSHTRWMRSGQP